MEKFKERLFSPAALGNWMYSMMAVEGVAEHTPFHYRDAFFNPRFKKTRGATLQYLPRSRYLEEMTLLVNKIITPEKKYLAQQIEAMIADSDNYSVSGKIVEKDIIDDYSKAIMYGDLGYVMGSVLLAFVTHGQGYPEIKDNLDQQDVTLESVFDLYTHFDEDSLSCFNCSSGSVSVDDFTDSLSSCLDICDHLFLMRSDVFKEYSIIMNHFATISAFLGQENLKCEIKELLKSRTAPKEKRRIEFDHSVVKKMKSEDQQCLAM